MNAKNLFAWATVAFPALAGAQSAGVTLYGNFDEYIGHVRSSSGAHVTGLNDGAILRSRLGVRGSEDLGDGLLLKYNLELGLNADTGTGADSSRLFDRQAWIGLATKAGEFRAGRQNTEIFMIGGAIDYTDRTTFGSVINTFGIPSRYDNDFSYRTPRIGGVELTLHYALPENGGGVGQQPARGNDPLVQLALDYTRAPFRFGYVGLQASPNDATATVHEKVRYHNVYANYRYGRGTLYAAFVRSNNSTASANGNNAATILSNVSIPNNHFAGTDLNAARYYNIWQVSADYRVDARLRVGALYGAIRDTSGGNAGARGASVGGFYDLSRRTSLFAFAAWLKNDPAAGFRFSSSAGPSANLAGDDVNGRRLTGLQLGVLHKF
ncbi:porin [Massilia dura]|uniref:Porin n=1 Tax=Pseudoduganella dura TaxID=321982 RepID=A0A6I3XCH3_9BURK|nr:porin [Pseudoduganella dura]MUI11231.1 porin [Pseudoduganella dura]GGX93879.1 outer membrane porin protein [Pseudoduganella dura]